MGATHTNPELQRCIRLEPAGRRRHWSPPSLEADLKHFQCGDAPSLWAEGGEGSWHDYPQTPLEDSAKLVEWRADQINTPAWWPELSAVPSSGIQKSLPRRLQLPLSSLSKGIMIEKT